MFLCGAIPASRLPLAAGSEFTQPKAHLLADPCRCPSQCSCFKKGALVLRGERGGSRRVNQGRRPPSRHHQPLTGLSRRDRGAMFSEPKLETEHRSHGHIVLRPLHSPTSNAPSSRPHVSHSLETFLKVTMVAGRQKKIKSRDHLTWGS